MAAATVGIACGVIVGNVSGTLLTMTKSGVGEVQYAAKVRV